METEFYKVDNEGKPTGDRGIGIIKNKGDTQLLFLKDVSRLKLQKGDFIRTLGGIIRAITFEIISSLGDGFYEIEKRND